MQLLPATDQARFHGNPVNMIWNIVDNRSNSYRWACIDAVIEPTWHDNGCIGADQTVQVQGETDFEMRKGLTLADAVTWAHGLAFPVTLYLRDAQAPAQISSAG